jgi:hypothetical protein
MPNKPICLKSIDLVQNTLRLLQPIRTESPRIENACKCLEAAENELLTELGKVLLPPDPSDNGTSETL